MGHSIKHLFHIAAPRAAVYEAITTISGLAAWWTRQTSGSPDAGGIIEFRFGPVYLNKMKVKELKLNESVTWEYVGDTPDWMGTVFTFKLDENEGKTRIRFEQANYKEQNDFYAQCNFSWGRYLVSLREYCEKGKGTPFGA
ncbi:MAG: SRPBCC domain-containing protein [Bacteroidia bacterium]